MNFPEALAALGVSDTTLTQEEKDQLDQNGYLILRNVLSPDQVSPLKLRLDTLRIEEGDQAGSDHPGVPVGQNWLGDLVNKGKEFDVCYTHPRLLAAAYQVLGSEFKTFSVCSNAPTPGTEKQGIHADSAEAVAPGDFKVCNSAWLITDFTKENGATRVIPGSHLSGKLPADATPEELAKETIATGNAGDVVVFNSHTWHGAGTNASSERRVAVLSSFTRRDLPQQVDQRKNLRPETAARISEAARFILDA